LNKFYFNTRKTSEQLVENISPEIACLQSNYFASPAKWHLAHTTWFFEEVILKKFFPKYRQFDNRFNYLFNSYYESLKGYFPRNKRGLIFSPSFNEVMDYRKHVDDFFTKIIQKNSKDFLKINKLLILGCHHEQQHQELLLMDLKNLFFQIPINHYLKKKVSSNKSSIFISPKYYDFEKGQYFFGAKNDENFVYDNERNGHYTYLDKFKISKYLVTNAEYLEFISDNGYKNFKFWLSDGFDWIKKNNISSPLYWIKHKNKFYEFTINGFSELNLDLPVTHISYYEADAFARWSGKRLPTEYEWELSSKNFGISGNFLESCNYHTISEKENHSFCGNAWNWTSSYYIPYPGFKPFKGILAEYNNKFMANQLVLRGGSCLTPKSHYRHTYRNFFYPHDRWQMSCIRLAI